MPLPAGFSAVLSAGATMAGRLGIAHGRLKRTPGGAVTGLANFRLGGAGALIGGYALSQGIGHVSNRAKGRK